jgi:hypothetical protein
MPAPTGPASYGQPIGLGIVNRGEHVALGLHGTEMLTHGFRIPVAGETAISDGSDRKLTNEVASVFLRNQPLAESGLWLPLVIVVISHSGVPRIVSPPIASE